MRSRAVWCVALLFGGCASHAAAATRGIRIDFVGDWGAAPFDIGTSDCAGTSASNVLVVRNGFTFSGDSDPNLHFNVDTYCQKTTPFDPGNPSDPYFSRTSFFTGDETGLAAMVGTNTDNAVSGIRYAYLGGNRFNNPNGFQWAFYFFPRGVTVVGLYGLTSIPLFDQTSYITNGGFDVWLGGFDGYDGQYFCFEGSGPGTSYIGEWNGLLSDVSSTCLQKIAVQFVDGFE